MQMPAEFRGVGLFGAQVTGGSELPAVGAEK